jgi:cytochrome c553
MADHRYPTKKQTTMRIHPIVLVSAWLAAISIAPSPACAQDAETERFATQICASCHGPGGESISPAFPKIAGQRAEYLENQLKAFRDHTRADPMAQAYMWGMTSQLSDSAIKNLAAFYTKQKPARGKAADPKLVEKGRALYEAGIGEAGKAQPCATCHGAGAEGNAIFPRLAGQHAEYLVKQLVLFKNSLREGSNAPLMHAITTDITFDQMEAVAAYLASL